jgi:hypothetical protein
MLASDPHSNTTLIETTAVSHVNSSGTNRMASTARLHRRRFIAGVSDPGQRMTSIQSLGTPLRYLPRFFSRQTLGHDTRLMWRETSLFSVQTTNLGCGTRNLGRRMPASTEPCPLPCAEAEEGMSSSFLLLYRNLVFTVQYYDTAYVL